MFFNRMRAKSSRTYLSEVKMHGLAIRAVQLFVIDCYGSDTWAAVCSSSDPAVRDFEPMLEYDRGVFDEMLTALENVLDRPISSIFEDLGTYLATHPNAESLRRLLRFGGVNFSEFLHSLNDLPDRARLAVAEMDLPEMVTREHTCCHFSLTCRGEIEDFGYVMVGLLRAMADDYGALALVELSSASQGIDIIAITLLDTSYAEGRSFELAGRIG